MDNSTQKPKWDPADPNAGHKLLDYHNREWLGRAGQMAGFLYLVGDIAFMSHASRVNNGGIDKLKMTRGIAYLLGSLILLCCTDKVRSGTFGQAQRDKIKRDLDTQVKEAGISEKQRAGLESWVKKELKEHPWELAYLLFITGSAMQGASAIGNKRYVEAAATLGTIASMVVPVVVPEGDQKPFIKLSENMEEQGYHFTESYKHIKQAMPILKPIFDINDAVIHQIQDHPLRVSAAAAIISNGMYGLQALQKTPVERDLAAMSALYLSANVATSFASKNMTPIQDWEKHGDELNEQMNSETSAPHHPIYSL